MAFLAAREASDAIRDELGLLKPVDLNVSARAVCRQTFPDEPKLPPLDAAKRLLAAALWKDRVQRLTCR